jgi:hypothetical protein
LPDFDWYNIPEWEYTYHITGNKVYISGPSKIYRNRDFWYANIPPATLECSNIHHLASNPLLVNNTEKTKNFHRIPGRCRNSIPVPRATGETKIIEFLHVQEFSADDQDSWLCILFYWF